MYDHSGPELEFEGAALENKYHRNAPDRGLDLDPELEFPHEADCGPHSDPDLGTVHHRSFVVYRELSHYQTLARKG